MAKDSFKEQFPDYPIIPSKRWKILDPLILVASLGSLLALFTGLFWALSQFNVPTPVMAGYNQMSLDTLRNQAMAQAEAGYHASAIKNFSQYFQLGGDDADAMAVYALSLDAQGQDKLAEKWSQKAIANEPESKAAQFVRGILEQKKK